jgi:hypothetical protein
MCSRACRPGARVPTLRRAGRVGKWFGQEEKSAAKLRSMADSTDNISIAGILGPWVKQDWDSSLIERFRNAY